MQSKDSYLKQTCEVCNKKSIEHDPKDLYDHFGNEFFLKFFDEFLKENK